MSKLEINLFGALEFKLDGIPLNLGRRKSEALLAYLAVTSQPQRRERLAALLWPDANQSRAYTYLRRSLSAIKQALDPERLCVDRETVELTSTELHLDVAEFKRLLVTAAAQPLDAVETRVRLLHAAAEVRRGEFMAGFTLPDCPEFDEWQYFQRQSLTQDLARALGELIELYTANDELEQAIVFARRWLALDPLQESAHRHLMQLLTFSGQRNAALAQYDMCRHILADELGVEPTVETTTLYQQIREGALVREQIAPATQRAGPPAPRHNLPAQLTPFIGREEELTAITSLLHEEPTCRLLTLVGPGGSGKSRLALQTAENSVTIFAHGVYFVSLAPISSVESVVPTIAAALNFQISTGNPQHQLLNYLREKEMLLVLDNFEQLIAKGATDLVSTMAAAAPRLKLLVTSRERLNLQEEWGVEVLGMRFPTDNEIGAESLESYSAIQLFLERARRARAGFALSDENRAHVVRICQLVEGMPLGLELAATWLRMMSCREIVQEIERSLDFLATSLRDVPARHHSLRAVFDHSWRLLPEVEKAVLRKLSVFRSGFSLRAAARIADASLLLLSALVDKSFLRRTRSGRYQIHELLRQYAAEELNDNPAARERTQDRHADYYLTFLRQRTEELKGPQGRAALQEISADFENVCAAWNRAVAQADFAALGKSAEGLLTLIEYGRGPLDGLSLIQRAKVQLEQKRRAADAEENNAASDLVMARLLTAEGVFSYLLAQIDRGQELLQSSLSLLQQIKPLPASDLARALYWLSRTYWTQGKYDDVVQHARESVTLYTKLGDRWGMAVALEVQGWVSTYRGDYNRANQLFIECLRYLEQRGEEINYRANVIAFLGLIARLRGEYAQAKGYLEEAWQTIREVGDLSHMAYSLRELGYLAIAVGDYSQAEASMREGAEIFEEFEMRHALVFPLDGLGTIARLQREYQQAQQLHRESLAMCQEFNERRAIALCLNNLGVLAYDMQDYPTAEQHLRESLTRYEEIGHRHGIALALCNLGYVLCALGRDRHEEARRLFQQSLDIALKIDARPVALNGLVGLATLLCSGISAQADLEQAVELLTLVLHHPASEQETKDKAKRLLDQLAPNLSPESMVGSQERGKARRLDTVLGSTLHIFAP